MNKLPPAPQPPFDFDPQRFTRRIQQMDPRWELKKMHGYSFKFSFIDCDAEISQADLLGAELWVVQSIRRQASMEREWLDVELEKIEDGIEEAEKLNGPDGGTAAQRALLYSLERTRKSNRGTKKIVNSFFYLTGDIQKLAISKEQGK